MILPVQFEEHVGELETKTSRVYFYGVEFANISVAAKILKQLPPGKTYKPGITSEGEYYIERMEDRYCFMFEDELWIPKFLLKV